MSEEAVQSITLPAIVDLDALEQVREQLLDAVGQGAVCLDGGQVERIATNALIMLLSAAHTAQQNTNSLTIDGISDAMQAAISRLGLDDRFAALVKG